MFADYVIHTADGAGNNIGWIVGATLGTVRNPGSWAARYAYARLEADAVAGGFSNSTFIGGTNGRGHILGLDYRISPQAIGGLAYYLNERNIGDLTEYRRFQADLNFRF